MANFKSWTVEWGLCSALGVHAPTPRSRAQPNSQLAYFPKPTIHPQQGCLPLLAAGMVTQLPINLGKRGAGQSQLPRLLFSSLSFHHSVSRGTGHKSPAPSPSLWFTTACALATQQNQPIGFPTRFDCPPWDGHRLRPVERKGTLPVPPIWPEQSAISCLYLPNKLFRLLHSLSSLQKDKPIHVLIGNEALFLSVCFPYKAGPKARTNRTGQLDQKGDMGLP